MGMSQLQSNGVAVGPMVGSEVRLAMTKPFPPPQMLRLLKLLMGYSITIMLVLTAAKLKIICRFAGIRPLLNGRPPPLILEPRPPEERSHSGRNDSATEDALAEDSAADRSPRRPMIVLHAGTNPLRAAKIPLVNQ